MTITIYNSLGSSSLSWKTQGRTHSKPTVSHSTSFNDIDILCQWPTESLHCHSALHRGINPGVTSGKNRSDSVPPGWLQPDSARWTWYPRWWPQAMAGRRLAAIDPRSKILQDRRASLIKAAHTTKNLQWSVSICNDGAGYKIWHDSDMILQVHQTLSNVHQT